MSRPRSAPCFCCIFVSLARKEICFPPLRVETTIRFLPSARPSLRQRTSPWTWNPRLRFAVFESFSMHCVTSRNWRPSSDMLTTRSSRPCNGTPNHASSRPSSPHLLASPYFSRSLLTSSHALPSPPTSTSLLLLFPLLLLPLLINSILCIFCLFSSSSFFFFSFFSSLFMGNSSGGFCLLPSFLSKSTLFSQVQSSPSSPLQTHSPFLITNTLQTKLSSC